MFALYITQASIDAGKPRACADCPIAQEARKFFQAHWPGIKRTYAIEAYVDQEVMRVFVGSHYTYLIFSLEPDARAFVDYMDNHGNPEPQLVHFTLKS